MIPSLIMQLIEEHKKNAKIKKNKCIKNGKVYYSVYKIIGLILLSLMISELILYICSMLFLGDLQGNAALISMLVFGFVIFYILLLIDMSHYKKLTKNYQKQIKK